MEYKASTTISIGISKKDFNKYAKPLISEDELKKEVISELNQCLSGIVDGDYGGNYRDWEHIFYEQLFINGFIEQTQASKNRFGIFTNPK